MATIKSYTLKDGSEKWEFYVSNGRDKGTGKPAKIHKRGFNKKTDAENAAKIIEGQIASKDFLKVNPQKMTIASFFDEWIENHKTKVKEGTRIVHRDAIRMYIKPYIGQYQLEKYNPTDHQKFINMLLTKKGLGRSKNGLSVNTVKLVNATLANGFKKAVQLGYVKSNPTRFLELPNVEHKKEPQYYSLEEVDAFLTQAKKEKEPLWYLFFLTIYDCGLRKAEAMALRWSDIDIKKKTVNVTKERIYKAETGRSRNIYIDDPKTAAGKRKMIMTTRAQRAFIDFYNEYYETSGTIPFTANNDDFIFVYLYGSSKNEIVRSRSVNTASDRIIRKAGLKKIRVHDARHTYAVRLRQADVPLEDIKDLLGHKDIATTQIYASISSEVKTRAVEKLNNYINSENQKASGEVIQFKPKKDSQ